MEDYVSKLQEDLRKKLDRLCLMHNEPSLHVAEHFTELRSHVDFDAERLLSEIQSVKRETGKATKDSDVNGTRLEFIRILEELEKRTGLHPKPEVGSSEVYALLEQRVDAFKDSSDSLDDLEDSYVQLAREINNETDRLEKSIFGEQTIIYCPSFVADRLGSLVYFGDIYFSRREIVRLMSSIFYHKYSEHVLLSEDFELLVPANEPSEINKSEQVIDSFTERKRQVWTSFARASKFWYIGKTISNYSGYSAKGSSIDREFVSYQYDNYDEDVYDDEDDYDEKDHALKVDGIYGFDNSANLFDVYSSQTCTLSITNARLNDLHTNLLPSPLNRLVTLHLIDVHFDSFDTQLLATFTSLTELKMQVTFSKQVTFDLAFLGALRKLETLELSLPHSPSDLSAFQELAELRILKLEGSSFFYAEKRPRLSKRALEQILSAPVLRRLQLSCFDIESIDRYMLKECKNLFRLQLARIRFDRKDDDVTSTNIETPFCFENIEKNVLSPRIEMIYSDLNATIFAGMINLNELSLTGNSITDLPRGVFEDLTCLIRLELSNNLIRHIRSGVFDNLKELKELKLDRNPIESIEANAFAELQSLTELLIVGCRLRSIDSEMFNGLSRLKWLNLNKNMIERIEVVAEDGRRINVAKTDLNEEEKELVKKHLFRDLFLFRLLDLSGNRVKKLDLNCFRNLINLQTLDLSSNLIDELSGKVDRELLHDLKDLRLNSNQLSSIDKSALPKNLSVLHLSNNQLKRLDDGFFAEFTQLESVNLSQNQLTWSITEATFASCNDRLQLIDLSRNESVQATKQALLQMSKLSYIKCDFNEHFACRPLFRILTIKRLTPEVVQALHKMYTDQPNSVENRLQDICLSGCSIRALTRNPNWYSELQQAPNLDHFNMSCISRLRRLEGLDISSNLIETLDDPGLFVDLKSIHRINLSCNRLSRIHRDIFKCLPRLESIDLSGNHLSSIDMGLFRHLNSLKHLNISSNNIAFLNLARLFRVCPNLTSLNLADNQLDERSTAESIDPRSFNFMETIILANNRFEKMDFVRDMPRLERLDLRGNRIESLLSNKGENLLGRLSKLTHLDLSQNRIRSMRDEMFDHLYHQLSFVDLSGNPCDFQLDSILSEII